LFVGRGVLNVREQSSVGVIKAVGDPRGEGNAVVAVTSAIAMRFRGRSVLDATAWAQRSRPPDGGDADGGSFRLPNDRCLALVRLRCE
jgi:hypothetical protein